MNNFFGGAEMLTQLGISLLGIFAVLVFLKIVSMPMKIIFRFIFNSVIGLALLYLLSYLGLRLPIPWWGYLVIGVAGVPGLIFMAVITLAFL